MVGMVQLTVILLVLVSCLRPSGAVVRVVGGQPVSEHRPWFVQLLDTAQSSRGFCGGALVEARVVITAAHCIDAETINTLHVALGFADGNHLNVNHPVKVQGVMVHPQYDPSDVAFDIAVLYLEDYADAQFERPVVPIQYARDVDLPERLHQQALVIGLGNLTSIGSIYDSAVHEVEVPLLTKDLCKDMFPDVQESTICAGDLTSGGRDSCQGDSGGPMVAMNSNGQLELVGIVSQGEGCAQKESPGLYVRVASHAEFIADATEDLTPEITEPVVPHDLQKLLMTRCLSQFTSIPINQSDLASHSRTTTFSVDLRGFELMPNDELPVGRVVNTCHVVEGDLRVEASWVLHGSEALTSRSKIKVFVRINGQWTLGSKALKLKYQQDTLLCATSQGLVMLADQRRQTYVMFRDVLYRLGEPAVHPGDSQVTWGCSVGDASIEVYEIALGGSARQLAARIHHKSIGTVSVALIRKDRDAGVAATLKVPQGDTKGTLSLLNFSDRDLFTWRMNCPGPFSITTIAGDIRSARLMESGTGYSVLFDAARDPEGQLMRASSLVLEVEASTVSALEACVINDVINVQLESL
jgi:trypsin